MPETYTLDYFLDELHRFRDIMGLTIYNQEQRIAAFRGICFVYIHLDDTPSNIEKAETYFQAVQTDYSLRMVLIDLKPLLLRKAIEEVRR